MQDNILYHSHYILKLLQKPIGCDGASLTDSANQKPKKIQTQIPPHVMHASQNNYKSRDLTNPQSRGKVLHKYLYPGSRVRRSGHTSRPKSVGEKSQGGGKSRKWGRNTGVAP